MGTCVSVGQLTIIVLEGYFQGLSGLKDTGEVKVFGKAECNHAEATGTWQRGNIFFALPGLASERP